MIYAIILSGFLVVSFCISVVFGLICASDADE